MTDEEFHDFKSNNPELAKYFEVNEDEEDIQPIDDLNIPDVPENAPIFD